MEMGKLILFIVKIISFTVEIQPKNYCGLPCTASRIEKPAVKTL